MESNTNKQDQKYGKLIVFEGISGCGKSTQMERLAEYLTSQDHTVVKTSWNSDRILSPVIRECKEKELFTPLSWSVLHAAEFTQRYTEVILPTLEAGQIILADRYYPTAYTRDTVRGVDLSYVENLYSFARVPDLIFFFDIAPEEAVKRREARHAHFYYYGSGGDLNYSTDLKESWVEYQRRLREKYFQLKDSLNLVVIDANRSIEEIFEDVSQHVKNIVDVK